MAMNVPFPLRVAAGAIAVGLDRLRTLPTDLPAMSVSLAGHAVRASMRVQQELAQLAARGEEVLSPLTDRPEEHPAWAHFDDEDENVVGDRADDDPDDDGADDDPGEDRADNVGTDGAADSASGEFAERASHLASTTAYSPIGAAADDLAALPGYDELSVAQLRARLRTLDQGAVAELLDYELGGRARAAFVTTLQNRLTSLRSNGSTASDAGERAGSGKRA
jgi:hypothetical protein